MTDTIKSRLIEGMRGQGIRLPDGDWLRLDDNNLGLIADRLLSLPGIAISDVDYLRKLEDAAATDIDRAFTVETREFSTGYRAAVRDVLAAAVQAQEEQ